MFEIFSDKIDTIKACMANFQLPTENQPNWAKEIDENQWKSHILEKIRQKNE